MYCTVRVSQFSTLFAFAKGIWRKFVLKPSKSLGKAIKYLLAILASTVEVIEVNKFVHNARYSY
jgi:hypothetical protein